MLTLKNQSLKTRTITKAVRYISLKTKLMKKNLVDFHILLFFMSFHKIYINGRMERSLKKILIDKKIIGVSYLRL